MGTKAPHTPEVTEDIKDTEKNNSEEDVNKVTSLIGMPEIQLKIRQDFIIMFWHSEKLNLSSSEKEKAADDDEW